MTFLFFEFVTGIFTDLYIWPAACSLLTVSLYQSQKARTTSSSRHIPYQTLPEARQHLPCLRIWMG